jgi:hypothetical protein
MKLEYYHLTYEVFKSIESIEVVLDHVCYFEGRTVNNHGILGHKNVDLDVCEHLFSRFHKPIPAVFAHGIKFAFINTSEIESSRPTLLLVILLS